MISGMHRIDDMPLTVFHDVRTGAKMIENSTISDHVSQGFSARRNDDEKDHFRFDAHMLSWHGHDGGRM